MDSNNPSFQPSGNNQPYRGGGNNSGNKPYFKGKPQEKRDFTGYVYTPYKAASIVIDKRMYNEEYGKRLSKIINTLKDKGYTIRYSGDIFLEEAFNLESISKLETYLPWSKYDQKEKGFSRYDEEFKHICLQYNPTFGAAPDPLQAMLIRTVAMVIGRYRESNTSILIVGSLDGVENGRFCTTNTGFPSLAMKVATANGIPIVNIRNEECESKIESLTYSEIQS